MSKFNIDTKVDINFTEDQIKAALTAIVQEDMPNVEIKDLKFVIKRNPTIVSVEVEASIKGYGTFPVEPENASVDTERKEVPEKTEEVTVKKTEPTTMGDIFGEG
jgi:hypothetical protein